MCNVFLLLLCCLERVACVWNDMSILDQRWHQHSHPSVWCLKWKPAIAIAAALGPSAIELGGGFGRGSKLDRDAHSTRRRNMK